VERVQEIHLLYCALRPKVKHSVDTTLPALYMRTLLELERKLHTKAKTSSSEYIGSIKPYRINGGRHINIKVL
jgi:hypothetical protein